MQTDLNPVLLMNISSLFQGDYSHTSPIGMQAEISHEISGRIIGSPNGSSETGVEFFGIRLGSCVHSHIWAGVGFVRVLHRKDT